MEILMTVKPYQILILCTGNSARSIMAEAIINTLGAGRFVAHSAGSQPAGRVHPLALEKLSAIGYPTAQLRSKSWDEFAAADAPQMDFIITVCDNAAGETCPLWPGQPISAHWGFPDPAAVQGSEAEQRAAFEQVFQRITQRVRLLLDLPLASLDALAIRRELQNIGRQDGAGAV
jgi:arsenate reductase